LTIKFHFYNYTLKLFKTPKDEVFNFIILTGSNMEDILIDKRLNIF